METNGLLVKKRAREEAGEEEAVGQPQESIPEYLGPFYSHPSLQSLSVS